MKTNSNRDSRILPSPYPGLHGRSSGPYRPILRFSKDIVPIHRLVFPTECRLDRSRSYCKFEESDANIQVVPLARKLFMSCIDCDKARIEADSQGLREPGSRSSPPPQNGQQEVVPNHISVLSSPPPVRQQQPMSPPICAAIPTSPVAGNSSSEASATSGEDFTIKKCYRKARGVGYQFTFLYSNSSEALSVPPRCEASPGWIYTHVKANAAPAQVWVMTATGEWVKAVQGFPHPEMQGYELSFASNGSLRWQSTSNSEGPRDDSSIVPASG